MSANSPSLARIRNEIFQTLARIFPITAASDEFPEFPQVLPLTPRWDIWDCFSEEMIEDIARKLMLWENQLTKMHSDISFSDPTPDGKKNAMENRIDIIHLINSVRNLRESLTIIRRWESQPTFYLTIASIGMAEAQGASNSTASRERARGLAAFFEQATRNLTRIPALFKRLGLEMTVNVRQFLGRLSLSIPELNPALEALDRFEATLRQLPTMRRFHLPADHFEKLLCNHLNTGMDAETIEACLETEIHKTRRTLNRITTRRFGGASLEAAYSQIPLPDIGADGLLGLYQRQVGHLAQFLVKANILPSTWVRTCPVRVQPVPGFLSATRSASSYSIPPGYPPSGGTFFVINADDPAEATRSYQREYRILTAHETYPGHHLLDTVRWGLDNPIRRVIEHPLFYEGWACFAEELMFRMGYLRGHQDLLMLTRRRFWRALRGKVDLGLQKGTMDLEMAARMLHQAGLTLSQSRAVVRKYALNPGYQICYTIGYQKFKKLFDTYGRGRLPQFVQTVLSQGEIHFEDLAAVLKVALV